MSKGKKRTAPRLVYKGMILIRYFFSNRVLSVQAGDSRDMFAEGLT